MDSFHGAERPLVRRWYSQNQPGDIFVSLDANATGWNFSIYTSIFTGFIKEGTVITKQHRMRNLGAPDLRK